MRGQYLTVEYVIFFAIGVIMIIAVYVIFLNVNQTIEKSITETQLEMVGEAITGAIINVFGASNSTNSTIYYNLKIPEKLSNCIYSISVTAENKLELRCVQNREMGIETTLYNFNINDGNIIYSTKGFIEIFVKNGVVELK